MKIVVLIAGGRAGSDFFQSLLDGHPEISQFPGIFAFDDFWEKIKKENKLENIAKILIDNYKHFFDSMLDFYFEHKEELDNWKIPNTGREQTIFNFMLEKLNIKKKYLPLPWNMVGMHRKDLFFHNNVLDDKTPYFLKYGILWHFTGFPIEDRIKIMGQVWDAFGGNYE